MDRTTRNFVVFVGAMVISFVAMGWIGPVVAMLVVGPAMIHQQRKVEGKRW